MQTLHLQPRRSGDSGSPVWAGGMPFLPPLLAQMQRHTSTIKILQQLTTLQMRVCHPGHQVEQMLRICQEIALPTIIRLAVEVQRGARRQPMWQPSTWPQPASVVSQTWKLICNTPFIETDFEVGVAEMVQHLAGPCQTGLHRSKATCKADGCHAHTYSSIRARLHPGDGPPQATV